MARGKCSTRGYRKGLLKRGYDRLGWKAEYQVIKHIGTWIAPTSFLQRLRNA
jgi:hypothetical protein